MASPGLPEDIAAGVTTGHVTDHEKIHDLLNEFDMAAQAEATGDLLVFQDGLIKRLPVGSNNQVLTADDQETAGVKWATPAGFTFGGTVYFTSSGTFTKADYPGLRAVKVKVQGGGGGGGEALATNTVEVAAGDGGGAGGYAEAIVQAASLGATETVTIGAGGAGGTGGNSAVAGGTSSFGSHASATGGAPGGSTRTGTQTVVRRDDILGGVGTAGDLLLPGGNGGGGFVSDNTVTDRANGGHGGNSQFGEGGRSFNSGNSGAAGEAGRGFGSGGSGACNSVSQPARAGGAGADGIVIVELFF